MRTNTEINTWEIKDNKYNLIGNARPKCWVATDNTISISNVTISEKELEDLTVPYITNDLAKIKIGNQEVIVNSTDLIVAVENALHSFRKEYRRSSGNWNPF